MELYSCAFANHGRIPLRHTGFGEDISPELRLQDIPTGTESIAIVMDDLDIPLRGELCHWLIWNIEPAEIIPEGLPHGKHIQTPLCACQGKAWGKNRYRGPKQPPFIHRAHTYRFTAFALDIKPELSADSGKAQLMRAMNGHILDTAELFGEFDPNQAQRKASA